MGMSKGEFQQSLFHVHLHHGLKLRQEYGGASSCVSGAILTNSRLQKGQG